MPGREHRKHEPGISWGIPSSYCRTGRKLAEDERSVCANCSVHGVGHYAYPGTKAANERRYKALMESPTFSADFLEVLTALHANGLEYFRLHDTGDFQSVEHVDMVTGWARSLPGLNIWVPTKEARLVATRARIASYPDNLTMRLSAPLTDGAPLELGLPTSTVHKYKAPFGYACPAENQEGRCNGAAVGGIDCRACWEPDEYPNISYHGRYMAKAPRPDAGNLPVVR
jgi:hypothetical protein